MPNKKTDKDNMKREDKKEKVKKKATKDSSKVDKAILDDDINNLVLGGSDKETISTKSKKHASSKIEGKKIVGDDFVQNKSSKKKDVIVIVDKDRIEELRSHYGIKKVL